MAAGEKTKFKKIWLKKKKKKSILNWFFFSAESMLYFVCLIKSDEQVLATSAVPAKNLTQLTLHIPDEIKLINLSSDFKVTIEIYYLELNKELLPHDIKYHISGKKVSNRKILSLVL